MEPGEPFAEFQTAVEKCRGLWKSIEVSSIAAQRGDAYYNSLTALRLRPEPPDEVSKLQAIRVDGLFAGRVVFPIDKLPELLSAIQAGGIPLGERMISLGNPPDRPGDPETFPSDPYHWYFRDLDAPQGTCWRTQSPASRRFEIHGNSQSPMRRLWSNQEWKFLEDNLARNDPPAADMKDLAQHVVQWDCGFDNWNTQPNVAIIAPLYSAFGPELRASKTSMTVRAVGPKTAQIADFSIAAVVSARDSTERTLFLSDRFEVLSVEPYLEFSLEIPAIEGLWLDATLLLRGFKAGRITIPISSENPRLLAHAKFDHEWGLLNRALGDGQIQPDAREFEVGVGWLFHLLGFQVVNYGLKELKPNDEIDLLAFVPYRSKLLAIEVTTRSPMKKDKLVTLRKRVDDLAAGLPGIEILGAFVSAHPSPFETEVAEARSLGMAAVYGEDLKRLMEEAVANRTPEEHFDRLKQVVNEVKGNPFA
jgi:hypothetical protein